MTAKTEYEIIETMSQSKQSVVYRVSLGEGKQAVIKTNAQEHPSPTEQERLRREYNLGQSFEHKNIIRYQDLFMEGHRVSLVVEDFGARGLSELLPPDGFSVEEFLPIALQVLDALTEVHRLNIVHKDIKPRNIVMDGKSGVVKLIDFGISSKLEREYRQATPPERLEGSILYISPEQTGRMNRALDYRSDFYSLGVTFYEMLTGKTPFTGEDKMEVVHAHISKKPIPPRERKESIPPALSDLVLKLMEKNAENRYQSCAGLRYDLQACLERVKSGESDFSFSLGAKDVSDRFSLPQKLYGREKETAELLSLIEKAIEGEAQAALVFGYSGVGKSALINEIHKPLVSGRGSFIEGKADQFSRKTPFAPFLQAFRELILSILTADDKSVAGWRERVQNAVGVNGKVILEVIPEVELLLGPQPDIAGLSPAERQNRFQNVFQEFIRSFAQADHPLAIFLDDLQWADQASLELLETLLTDADLRYLVFLGAYRDNEVDKNHPLIKTLDKVREVRELKEISLGPLQAEEVCELTADTLRRTPEEAKELADLIHAKTNGNPFFTSQFLTALHQDELLEFDHGSGCWNWELEKIKERNVTDNVVDLMTQRISRLPEENRNVLGLAAGVGDRFSLSRMATALECDFSEAYERFAPAVQEGLLVAMDQNFARLEFTPPEDREKYDCELRFLHDRVQQASYSLIPEEEWPSRHLQIGRFLLQRMSAEEQEEHLFLLLEQLNAGYSLIEDPEEKKTLAEMNLRGGRRARNSVAYDAGVDFLKISMELLPEGHWKSHYKLSFEIYRLCAECEFLLSNLDRAVEIFESVIGNAESDAERAMIHVSLCTLYIGPMRLPKAIEHGLQALKICGFSLDLENAEAGIGELMGRVARNMEGREIASLIDLPEMEDPIMRTAMSVVPSLAICAFLSGNFALFPLAILTGMNITLENGGIDLAAVTCAYYTILLLQSGDHKARYEFARLAFAITEKYSHCRQAAGVFNVAAANVLPYHESYENVIQTHEKGYRLALDSGDLLFQVANHGNILYHMCSAGYALSKIKDYCGEVRDLGRKSRVYSVYDIATSLICLMDVLEDQSKLGQPEYSQTGEVCFPEEGQWERIHTTNSIGFVSHYKMQQEFWYRQFPSAKQAAEDALTPLMGVAGYPVVIEHKYYHALILCALCKDASPEEQAEYKKTIGEQLEVLRLHADLNQRNFFHLQRLVEAELARVNKAPSEEVWPLYREAISGANDANMLPCMALGNELFGYYWLELGLDEVARGYLTEAHYVYRRWGAPGKVKALEEAHPGLFLQRMSTGEIRTTDGVVTSTSMETTGEETSLDVETVIKTSRAISRELSLEKLLSRLMKIIVENAGAQKGFLILMSGEEFRIEGSLTDKGVRVLESQSLEESQELSLAIARYTLRTGENTVLQDARKEFESEGRFAEDSYIKNNQPRSVLCMPIRNQDKIGGALYLENNLSMGAFTRERTELLDIILAQASVSLENARVYEHLEELVKERTRELEKTHKQLLETAHRAGMAEVATNVLHNVGNALSGALTPATLLGEQLGASRVTSLAKVVDLFKKNQNDLPGFFSNSEKGVKLIEFIEELYKRLLEEREGMSGQVSGLLESIGRIGKIIQLQQSYAGNVLLKEELSLSGIVEDALQIESSALEQNNIEVIREFADLPPLVSDRHKLMNILLNLLSNARDALGQSSEKPGGKLTLCVESGTNKTVLIKVIDDGPGIPSEFQTRIFQNGYTTKEGGSGYGLHGAANTATELGGSLNVISEGAGFGATFVLTLPG